MCMKSYNVDMKLPFCNSTLALSSFPVSTVIDDLEVPLSGIFGASSLLWTRPLPTGGGSEPPAGSSVVGGAFCKYVIGKIACCGATLSIKCEFLSKENLFAVCTYSNKQLMYANAILCKQSCTNLQE